MKKQKVLITGSSSGLGKALSIFFSKKGHDIIAHGRDKARLEDLKKEIRTYNVNCETYKCNLNSLVEVKGLAEFSVKNNVKVLINNAGLLCQGKELKNLNDNEIIGQINVNLLAPILLSKYLSEHVNNIININSMVGREIKKHRTIYSASKWGLRGFSNSLRMELNHVKILDVYPTNIQTSSDKKNSMNIDFVCKEIYTAYLKNDEEIILDGRNL